MRTSDRAKRPEGSSNFRRRVRHVPPATCIYYVNISILRKHSVTSSSVIADIGTTEFRDFVTMGSYGIFQIFLDYISFLFYLFSKFYLSLGVWRHLDETRGFTTLKQKVKLLRLFAKEHFPKQLPYFEGWFDEIAAHAERHNI